MTDSFEHDDELLARLRASDPASSLPPAAPDDVARLLEDTMSNDVLTESRDSGTHGRGPLTWLVAAAAAVVIAGAGAFAVLGGGDDDPVPSADPSSASDPASDPSSDPASDPSSAGDTSVTELTAPSATSARCMVPSAEAMADNPVAFDGTVQSIEGDVVTLAPTTWYAGDATDLVTVEAPPDELRTLLVSVDFQEGERYLVTATAGGAVMICGFSAPYSPGLAGVYAEAFGG